MKRVVLLLSLLFCWATVEAFENKLPSHPRLILRQGDIMQLRHRIETDSMTETLNRYILRRAETMLSEETSIRQKTGKRLLTVSRTVMERVLFCSYVYLTTNDIRYAERAEREMLAAASFEDWNPSHFLDVAEMTIALALGYDWLYDFLSEESRHTIEQAIVEKGLNATTNAKQMWFYGAENNWNQVCNAGMVLGALAVGDKYGELLKPTIQKSLDSNPLALVSYKPDGVYPEGFSYWSYGTWFQVLLIEALRTAVGDDFDIAKSAGFLESAYFMSFMQAPSGNAYNFSDSSRSKQAVNPLLAWFAAEIGDSSVLWNDYQSVKLKVNSLKISVAERRLLPVAMLFLGRLNGEKIAPPNRDFWSGQGSQPLFVFRSDWDDLNGVYLAAKGGSPSLSHAHMDGGSFVYEWGGVRWACDLGSQNYHSLESKGVQLWKKGQNSGRWSVYRLSPYSHNTLTINDKLHRYEGQAKMVKTFASSSRRGAKFDLSELFFDAKSVHRTIAAESNGVVRIEDKITAGSQPCRVRWTMMTEAEVENRDGRSLNLHSKGRTIELRASAKMPFRIATLSAESPHDYDAPNPGITQICIDFEIAVDSRGTLCVELVPQR